jgi:hypothetical protein
VYRDYSLRKRIPTKENVTGGSLKKKISKQDLDVEARLQCLEIDNENPLSNFEWRNLSNVVNEVKGLGWF